MANFAFDFDLFFSLSYFISYVVLKLQNTQFHREQAQKQKRRKFFILLRSRITFRFGESLSSLKLSDFEVIFISFLLAACEFFFVQNERSKINIKNHQIFLIAFIHFVLVFDLFFTFPSIFTFHFFLLYSTETATLNFIATVIFPTSRLCCM
jgi:hypothetical protein